MTRSIFLTIVFLAGHLPSASHGKVLMAEVGKSKRIHTINSSLKTEEYRLPNGLSVFLTVNKFAPNAVVSHWVKAGSLHERSGITGIAHLFEHMMFRPLKPGDPTFFDIAGKLGADFNANTRFESTYFYSAVPNKNLIKLLEAESNRFKNLIVTDAMLDAERKAVWSEYSTKFDANPQIDLWFQIYQRAYVAHPFGWMIIGFREDLEKIKAKDCNEFFKNNYAPNNTGLFVTGNFDSSQILREVVRLYGDWSPGRATTLPVPFGEKTTELVTEGKLPSTANEVLFGFRTPYFDKTNSLLLTLVNFILFDSKNGLLKRRLIDSQKIASDINEFNFGYDNGMLKAGISLLPSTSVDDLRKQIEQISSDFSNLTNDEFNVYKRQLFVSESEALQRNVSLAEFLAKSWGKYGDTAMTHKLVSGEIDLEKQEVSDFLNRYFVANNFVYLSHKKIK